MKDYGKTLGIIALGMGAFAAAAVGIFHAMTGKREQYGVLCLNGVAATGLFKAEVGSKEELARRMREEYRAALGDDRFFKSLERDMSHVVKPVAFDANLECSATKLSR